MKTQIYQLLHVFSVIMLFALTFFALAAPTADRRRPLLMWSGILALVVFVSGFGMISAIYGNQFTGWMVVKMVVWLILAALSGLVFRRPHLARPLGFLFAGLGLIAVFMVYFKPF